MADYISGIKAGTKDLRIKDSTAVRSIVFNNTKHLPDIEGQIQIKDGFNYPFFYW